MNWAWAKSLDQLWHTQSLPMWLALVAAMFFGLIVLATLLRAEKSVANGALTVITLLAIGIAAAATIRGSQGAGPGATPGAAAPVMATASLPALSCLDELAGDMVLAACEKVLFGSADSTAAAVSMAAAKINRLLAYGNVARTNASMTPELLTLRQALEHDRYGLVAYVLQSRDRCMPEACPAYASLTDVKQIAANMSEHTYEGLVTRYASSWNASPQAANVAALPANSALAGTPALAGLPPSVPTGKPTTADFPSASSIPPVSIMTDTPAPAPKPAAQQPATPRATTASAAVKKQASPKAARPQSAAPAAPVPLAPEAAEVDKPGG